MTLRVELNTLHFESTGLEWTKERGPPNAVLSEAPQRLNFGLIYRALVVNVNICYPKFVLNLLRSCT